MKLEISHIKFRYPINIFNPCNFTNWLIDNYSINYCKEIKNFAHIPNIKNLEISLPHNKIDYVPLEKLLNFLIKKKKTINTLKLDYLWSDNIHRICNTMPMLRKLICCYHTGLSRANFDYNKLKIPNLEMLYIYRDTKFKNKYPDNPLNMKFLHNLIKLKYLALVGFKNFDLEFSYNDFENIKILNMTDSMMLTFLKDWLLFYKNIEIFIMDDKKIESLEKYRYNNIHLIYPYNIDIKMIDKSKIKKLTLPFQVEYIKNGFISLHDGVYYQIFTENF